MRILFVTAEAAPLAKTGGLGDVCGALPKVLRKMGHEVVLFLPYYRQARHWLEEHGIAPEVLANTQITWANWSAEATFLRAALPGSDVPVVLVANDYFFNRDQIYAPRLDGFDDYILRYTFFCRAVIAGCDLVGFTPDILHAHDWHTALLPVYLHSGLRSNERFRDTRSVYTIHNLNYQGNASSEAYAVTGLHSRYWAPDAVEHFGQLNPMKGGILFADQVTTVSPTYAREIQTSEHGAGLDGVLRALNFKLTGILNGIDVDEWNPEDDVYTGAAYSAESLTGKTACKRAVLREAGLKYKAKTPLLTVVSRLVDQKGFHLLIPILPPLIDAGAQVIVLGSGEPRLEEGFRAVERAFPHACRVWTKFDHALAHRIYAGADLLLMPSIYEPCGLNQMYALRYGTLPVVRLTGGLVDSVTPYNGANLDTANGFAFRNAAPGDLHSATWIGMLNYRIPETWKELQTNAMSVDFSWERSAAEYEHVYRRARW